VRRIHNSSEGNLVLSNREQKGNFVYKPNGLWYGIDEEWLDWCKSEEQDWIHRYNYELEVDLSKMLMIGNKEQLMQFHSQFYKLFNGFDHIGCIDWESVANKYAGLEINPYLWECRLLPDVIWYYGWDCASGCIWDVSIILSLRR
jgi:hypothetical protein